MNEGGEEEIITKNIFIFFYVKCDISVHIAIVPTRRIYR